MRLLLLNANTTCAVTDFCVDAARRFARPDTIISGSTGQFGAANITSRAQNVVAGHALIDLVQQHASNHDCILIAVSYDTALLAAREISQIPVIGEAALRSASLVGRRIGLV
ncbi:MAG: aspartate/glutamate racemase family protein, partial [Devosia sp.]